MTVSFLDRGNSNFQILVSAASLGHSVANSGADFYSAQPLSSKASPHLALLGHYPGVLSARLHTLRGGLPGVNFVLYPDYSPNQEYCDYLSVVKDCNLTVVVVKSVTLNEEAFDSFSVG